MTKAKRIALTLRMARKHLWTGIPTPYTTSPKVSTTPYICLAIGYIRPWPPEDIKEAQHYITGHLQGCATMEIWLRCKGHLACTPSPSYAELQAYRLAWMNHLIKYLERL